MAKTVQKKPKIKGKQGTNKISFNDIQSFKPTHMKFNLSFVTTNNTFSFDNTKFTDVYKAQFLKRMFELSSEDYIVISGRNKSIGIEFIDEFSLKRPVECKKGFYSSDHRKNASEKYAVFRLYSNNNPIAARIIGKIVNKIFYVMFIDLEHELYDG